MIFTEKPKNFNAKVSVVACYVFYNDTFALLHRQPHKTSGSKWGLPAGKVDSGESHEEAMVRELFEETGIAVKTERLERYPSLFVRHEDRDFDYHTFAVEFKTLPEITLRAEEHQDYVWVTPAESLTKDLIHDLDVCNELFLNP
jgi:8-oxo-dGTP pyrophosphatase MutT (NUDIX family)